MTWEGGGKTGDLFCVNLRRVAKRQLDLWRLSRDGGWMFDHLPVQG